MFKFPLSNSEAHLELNQTSKRKLSYISLNSLLGLFHAAQGDDFRLFGGNQTLQLQII